MMATKRANFAELWRFYQAAIINTAFGYGLFALLIYLHVNLFAAQTIAFVSGSIFNYFTYSHHVFRTPGEAKAKFILSYFANYFINLAMLAFFNAFITNHYLSGALASISTSLISYFSLKYIVFAKRDAA